METTNRYMLRYVNIVNFLKNKMRKDMKSSIVRKIGLGIVALVLSGCGGNPMLKSEMMNNLEASITQNSSLTDRISCVEYGSNPSVFNLRQPVCSTWMQNQYKNFASTIAAASINNTNATQAVPTFVEFTDPKVWQTLWNQDSAKWQQELATEKLNKETALITEAQAKLIAEQAKLLKAQTPAPAKVPATAQPVKKKLQAAPAPAKRIAKAAQVHCVKPIICQRHPLSIACEKTKQAMVRNGINPPICG